MFLPQSRVHDVEGLLTRVEAVGDERAKDAVLFVDVVEEPARSSAYLTPANSSQRQEPRSPLSPPPSFRADLEHRREYKIFDDRASDA
jgi:hypothetical protein